MRVCLLSALHTYRHGDLGEVSSDAVLHDGPEVETMGRFGGNCCTSPGKRGLPLLKERGIRAMG